MKRKVLVIDDDQEWLDLVSVGLGGDYEVLTATDGDQGLQAAGREYPDLILCDVVMPRMTGSEVLKALQLDQALFLTPVVMMTAQEFNLELKALFESHPNVRAYLKKPFKLEELKKTVADLIGAAPVTPKRLPAAKTPAPAPLKATPAPGPAPRPESLTRPLRVLVVDDEVAFFELVTLSLPPECQVFRASEGAQVMDQLQKARPHVILADFLLPGFSAIELLRALSHNPARRGTPVVVTLDGALPEAMVSALRKDFPNLSGVLSRPCDGRAVLAAVESARKAAE